MPVYTVESARERKRKQTDFGEKVDFGINFKEFGEEVSWFTNATTPMPNAGEKLEGEITPSEYGPKFRKARANGFGHRTPRDSGRIERQHSQDMAIQLAAAFEPRTEGRTAKAYLLADQGTDRLVRGRPRHREQRRTRRWNRTSVSCHRRRQIEPRRCSG